jgi:hypothetical protein
VDARDRRLDRVRAWLVDGHRSLGERRPLGDERAIPERAVLVGQQDHVAAGRCTGRPASLVEEHEGEQTVDLGVRQQLAQQAPQPDRLSREVGPGQ